MDDLKKLWKETSAKSAKSAQPLKPLDINILTPEQRTYLERAPNLQKFIDESIQFREEAHVFLEKTFPEILTKRENLREMCENTLRLSVKRQIAISRAAE